MSDTKRGAGIMRARSSLPMEVMSSMPAFPVEGLTTDRLLVRPVGMGDAAAVLAYHSRNRAHLQPWEPLRGDDFYSLAATQVRVASAVAAKHAGIGVHLLLLARESGELIGTCDFSNMIFGVFQACHLGFSVSANSQGQGYMREGVGRAIEEVFARFDLHRIMANHRPENLRSANLLHSLGFEREGLARSYLKINGVWTDHVLNAKINPNH